jgi:hypothetical protein
MKINLQTDIDRESFLVDEHVIAGETVYLVTPKRMGVNWNQENKIFRSSIWNSEGNLISASFPKFMNWGENEERFPTPNSLDKCTIVEKLDGSLLCVSKYKGQYILRTRGTSNAFNFENGHELKIFESTILDKLKDENETWDYSILFEWMSPNNVIILNYGDEPIWKLIGFINHHDYSLADQVLLDLMAKKYDLLRPEYFTFKNITDLVSSIQKLKGKEGVCVYSKKGQVIHKLKSADYLVKHRFKSSVTLENTLDLYFANNQPKYQDFVNILIDTFDYECFEMVRGYVSEILDASKEVEKIVDGFHNFIYTHLVQLKNRKLQAEKVIQSYSTTNRSSMLFTLLDKKPLSREQLEKLFWQVLKTNRKIS